MNRYLVQKLKQGVVEIDWNEVFANDPLQAASSVVESDVKFRKSGKLSELIVRVRTSSEQNVREFKFYADLPH
jgi:hypothetical protein